MTKHPPNRRGIAFEVGAQLEARDRLKKWYAAHIEEIDYEEGKVLIHFKRWNHRYDEWFCWDSPYLRPLEKIQLRREGLVEEEPPVVFRVNEQVLACWSDCRFYPAKVTSVNRDGTYTVKFFDGVIQTVKNIHVKAFSKDQANVARSKQRERPTESTSPSDKHSGKFREQKKTSENSTVEKEKPPTTDKKAAQPDKDKKPKTCEKSKLPIVKNEKEDKENISENERESSAETRTEERSGHNDSSKAPHENGDRRKKRDLSASLSSSDQASQTLQPVTLELRRRKISIASEIPVKRPRLEKRKNAALEAHEKNENVSLGEPQSYTEDGEDEKLIRPTKPSPSRNQEDLCVLEAPAPSAPVEDSLSDSVSVVKQEGKTEDSLAVVPEPPDVKNVQSSEDITESASAGVLDSLPEHKSDNLKEIPALNEIQMITALSEPNTLQTSLRSLSHDGKDRRHSTPATNSSNACRASLKEKSKENQIQKFHCKPEKVLDSVKEKVQEKCKDFLSLQPKRKNKRSKSDLSSSEETVTVPKELSSPQKSPIKLNNNCKIPCSIKTSDNGKRRDTAKISDEETLSDSCTESLLWSDDDYNEEIDVTNADEEMQEEEGDCEIVRCMCEVQEENDFMIQCEECLCWQHGVCMGLLEDNVPEKYTCYICQDPPGQRLSLKYWYDKEWLNEGHMHGLSFLEENYSHQNAKKIVATHQLLGDVQRVIEVLHGLQLKMSILQSKEHPDLKFWGQPWKQRMMNNKCYLRQSMEENSCKADSTNYRTYNGAVDKPSSIPYVEESYITSEHCYQKPRTYYPAVEQRLVVETRSSSLDGGVDRIRQSREDSIAERLGWELDRELLKTESESKHNYCKVRDCLSKRNPPQESPHAQPMDNGDATVSSQLQWQLNLLAHLESLQDEVTHRMDFIEKELDVLESFLDYTGELEPPEPLARLPQLKHRIKQLLMDLGKVEQIALCST
ncbi:PHD finger protein 20 isoform X4 [Pseudophryne corroboree]|uniref:PHD finger protein 20 isoform X4 n=1 Tax=Pseudophryne corroboree TaxID=495146 RepID=UPI003081A535